MARFSVWVVVALSLSATVACSTRAGSTPDSPASRAFPAGMPGDYQLGGPYPPPDGAAIVVRDSTAAPVPGHYNICYVNGFQTQPEQREFWLEERRELVLFGRDGRPLTDENWPDELIVDTSTTATRARLARIVGNTITLCADAGFDAVEIDNLDSHSRSRGALTVEDNLEFAGELARIAHRAGLLIGQKNAAELGDRGKREAGFDFAVAEECLRYTECDTYTAVYGKHVLDIEYTDNLPGPLAEVCGAPERPESTMIRDRDLVPRGAAGHFYRHC